MASTVPLSLRRQYKHLAPDATAFVYPSLHPTRPTQSPSETRGVGNGVGVQMVQAVEHVHARRVLHRDLKPANVFVAPPRRLKLGDFGIARQLSTHTALAGSVVGACQHRTRSRGCVCECERCCVRLIVTVHDNCTSSLAVFLLIVPQRRVGRIVARIPCAGETSRKAGACSNSSKSPVHRFSITNISEQGSQSSHPLRRVAWQSQRVMPNPKNASV